MSMAIVGVGSAGCTMTGYTSAHERAERLLRGFDGLFEDEMTTESLPDMRSAKTRKKRA